MKKKCAKLIEMNENIIRLALRIWEFPVLFPEITSGASYAGVEENTSHYLS
jgi:hypothetical protein